MKLLSRVQDFTRSGGLILVLTAGPLAACAGDTGTSDAFDGTASDLKGGVPAKGKGKGKGEVAGGAAVVEDAGPADGNGKSDKVKKDKAAKEKTHGKSAEAAGGDADEGADETP